MTATKPAIYEQQQIDQIIEDKQRSDDDADVNLAYMSINSENASTKAIVVSLEQLKAIRKILG